MIHRLDYDVTDLVFRVLFSLIFLGLGLEHLFADELIRGMMPDWLPLKRFLSLAAGLVLVGGGLTVLLGYRTREGAVVLGLFLILVSGMIHLPAIFAAPSTLPSDWRWLWDVYQRGSLVKNLCLLGACFHLVNHEVGRFSLERRLAG